MQKTNQEGILSRSIDTLGPCLFASAGLGIHNYFHDYSNICDGSRVRSLLEIRYLRPKNETK